MSGVRCSVRFAMAAACCACVAPSDSAAASGEWTVALAARGSLADLGNRPAAFLSPPQIPDEWETDDWDWVKDGDALFAPEDDRSPLKAVGASLLLPGLGERYVEPGRRSTLFFALEATIWSTWAFYRIQAEDRESRHEEFAVLQGAAAAQEDDDYYEHIGLWLSLDEWHEIVRRDARFRFPDDPGAQEAYFQENQRYDESQSWEWEDDATRLRFRQLRSRSERSFRNARLAAGAAIFNRFASAIDALAMTRSFNAKANRGGPEFSLRVAPRFTDDGLAIGPILSTRY